MRNYVIKFSIVRWQLCHRVGIAVGPLLHQKYNYYVKEELNKSSIKIFYVS